MKKNKNLKVSIVMGSQSDYKTMKFAANILKNLVSSGLIVSSRGQRGGYMLSRSAENINLSEIINATDNPFKLVECCKDEYTCKVHNQCPTKTPLLVLHSKIQQFFEETTLNNLEQNLHLYLYSYLD